MRLDDCDQTPAKQRDIQHDQGDEDASVEQAAGHPGAARSHDEHAQDADEQHRDGQERGQHPLAVVCLADAGKDEREERRRR